MPFPPLPTAKTLLDAGEQRPCDGSCGLCVFYRSLPGDWQARNYKEVKMVIMRVQLFSYCLLRRLDTGRSLCCSHKWKNKGPFCLNHIGSGSVLSRHNTDSFKHQNFNILVIFTQCRIKERVIGQVKELDWVEF